jgi:folate-binding protein YgfZ
MTSPLLATPGAVSADGIDAGVAEHYGDPYGEQRAVAGGFGVVDRSHRGVLRITGADRLSWLHSLTTQDLEQVAPGPAVEALVLSPQGRVEHHLTLTDDGSATWIHVEPGEAGSLLEFLNSMRFMMRVDPADVTAEHAVLTILGPALPGGDLGGIRLDTSFGTDLIVRRETLADVVAGLRSAGGALAGMWAYEALRIAAGRPRLGLDTDHRTIPHEVGWIETAVHLTKGCYRGQETVAWCSYTSTEARTSCPPTALTSCWTGPASASPGRPHDTTSLARSPWRWSGGRRRSPRRSPWMASPRRRRY